MPQPFRITTPFPSVEEVAERSGVSPARTKELIELAHRMMEGSEGASGSATVRKASKSSLKGLGRKKRK